jgi:Rhodopirellula transposase DDE domain
VDTSNTNVPVSTKPGQLQPEPVRVHDFVIPELGKAVPFGVYDIADNVGWVNLGISHDTAIFSVESIRRWWYELGTARYPTVANRPMCAKPFVSCEVDRRSKHCTSGYRSTCRAFPAGQTWRKPCAMHCDTAPDIMA